MFLLLFGPHVGVGSMYLKHATVRPYKFPYPFVEEIVICFSTYELQTRLPS
jgi:hypothetical protein